MTVMTGWDLFEDLSAAHDEMLRAARVRGWRVGQHGDGTGAAVAWAPAVEVTERKDAYWVTVEVPGVKAGEVEVTFENGLLTIQGERHVARDAAGERVHRSERHYGAFQRSITMPSHVQADKIEANTQDGLLQVMVPKAPDVQAKRIQVRAGHPESARALSGKAAKD